MAGAELYIGLMSGTSADAIDAVLVDFSQPPLKLLAHHSSPLPPDTRAAIHKLAQPGSPPSEAMARPSGTARQMAPPPRTPSPYRSRTPTSLPT